MLNKLLFCLRSRGCKEETTKAVTSRAKIILSVKAKWSKEDAENYVYERAHERDYSESTINKWFQTFNIMSSCFEWNWQEKFKKIKENCKSPEMLSIKELRQFYQLTTLVHWDLIIRLSISTGARPSEILTLRRFEIDTQRQVICLNHTKTKRNRLLLIQDFLVEETEAYFSDNSFQHDDYIFPSHNKNKSISVRALEKEFTRRLSILGIEKHITPYSMRHAYLTRMASKINIILLKELAGHSSTKTTERYVHHNEFILREAADKDFLFDEMRDIKKKVENIIETIRSLDDYQINKVELCTAIVHLQKSVLIEN